MSWQWSFLITLCIVLSWPAVVVLVYRRMGEIVPAFFLGSLLWFALFGLGGLFVGLFHALRGAHGCG